LGIRFIVCRIFINEWIVPPELSYRKTYFHGVGEEKGRRGSRNGAEGLGGAVFDLTAWLS